MILCCLCVFFFFFFKQKTAYEVRISDWSSDVCSSDLAALVAFAQAQIEREADDRAVRIIGCEDVAIDRIDRGCGIDEGRAQAHILRRAIGPAGRIEDVIERASKRDRKSVVSGKSVSVRVDLVGRRIIKKTKTTQQQNK